jgi:tetratricopeptide (TPR) repeat protein
MSRIEQLQKLREADPTDADVPYMLAQEHAKEGDAGAAIDAFDACLELDPDYHYAYFHKAKVLEREGRTDEAASVLRDGFGRAQAAGHAKAVNEISGYLDELTG